MRKRSLRNLRNKERGIALLIALMALFLISDIGLGMIYMANTETSINSNYRDEQQAFFTMRGGLEEMRDRIRGNAPSPITLPAVMPSSGTAGSIVYILNPGASETVNPTTATNQYFDDEFCHESFTTLTLTNPGTGVPCGSAGAPPSGAVTTVASVMPYTGTSSSLKYKWVRITLKQNGTFPTALVAPIDSTHPAASQVCWDTANSKEVVLYALGSTYTSCDDARAHGFMVEPVYIITSLAITPQGSRRIGQYETAALSITPPASGLVLDGPTPSFGTPHSANAGINGTDGSGTPPAVSGCSPNTGAQPAIGTDNSGDATNVAGQIFRPDLFTGQGATPSVVNDSSLLGNWSTPGQLNAFVSEVASGADATYNCSINGVANAGATSACSGTYGSDASPQITYVNGDVTLGGGAGVLVVTGTVTIHGNMEFDGLLLVIGQGAIVIDGGGHGSFYGEMLVAKTNSATSPFAQLGTLGIPSFTWNGGGKSDMYYNSCWADIGNKMHYVVLASREEMY